MSHRFFCQQPPDAEGAFLAGSEAHHLTHVMRLSVGDRVVLFDGSGSEFAAEVRSIGRNRVELDIAERVAVDRELGFELVIGVALPKGDRQRWLVEKAVELGVARLLPLRTRRGVAQPVAAALDRLRRAVVEASKQCGRNRLMLVDEPADVSALLMQSPMTAGRFIAHPGQDADSAAEAIGECRRRATPIFLAVGPEGGFDDEELAAATSSGWQTVNLGPRVLRVETAALALAALAACGA